MKRKLLFLIAFMLTICANAKIDEVWFSLLETNQDFYLYNVETGTFLTADNEYGTRASVTTSVPEHTISLVSNSGKYRIKYGNFIDYYLDCLEKQSKSIWVDGGGRQGDGEWTFERIGNSYTYHIYNTIAGTDQLGVHPDLTNTRIDFDEDATARTWALINVADYNQYLNLNSKHIPAYLTIGEGAFRGCTSLKIANLPTSAFLASRSFADCSNLEELTIKGNADIVRAAFSGSSLKTVDVQGVLTLPYYVFWGCESLNTVWAKSVTNCNEKAFYNCENLTYIGVGDYYKDCNGPNYLAEDGVLLTGAINSVIGSDVKTIGNYAFAGRGIKKINIPASVTKIGNYAFENCTALEEVQVNWDMPLSVPASTFEGVDCSNVTLYCPEDVEDFYSMTSVWSNFFTKAGEIDNERLYYAEVGKASYATTYFPASVVVPKDVTAYYISAVSENGTSLVMNELETIPANTGVLLHASAGMHTFNAAANEADALADNKLVKVAAGVNVPASDATNANYVLQKQDKVAFYKVTEPKETSKPSAYLQLPANSTNVKMFALDEDAVTAIQALTTNKSTEIYDLSGRKLSKLQKGINIVNGVKILVK